MKYQLDDILVDTASKTVEFDGRPIAISPRLFAVLRILVEHAGTTVSRDRILAEVWADAHVVPNSVAQAVAGLRDVLSSSRGIAQLVAVPKIGYRINDPVTVVDDAGFSNEEVPRRRRGWWVQAAAGVAAGALLAGSVSFRPAQVHREALGTTGLLRKGAVLLASRRPDALRQAAALFSEAATMDKASGTAWSNLAETHYLMGFYGVEPVDEAVRVARSAATRALAVEPSAPRPYVVRASIALDGNWDLTASAADFRRALLLNPNDAQIQQWSAWWCLAAGLMPEARAAMNRAVALDPFSASVLTSRATFAYLDGDYQRAMADAELALTVDPTFFRAQLRIGLIHLQSGSPNRAVAELEAANRMEPRMPETIAALASAYAVTGAQAKAEAMLGAPDANLRPYDRAIVLTGLGRADEAVAALKESRQRRQLIAGLFEAEPRLKALRYRADFRALTDSVSHQERPELPFGRSGPTRKH